MRPRRHLGAPFVVAGLRLPPLPTPASDAIVDLEAAAAAYGPHACAAFIELARRASLSAPGPVDLGRPLGRWHSRPSSPGVNEALARLGSRR